jgi:hypothetical protein
MFRSLFGCGVVCGLCVTPDKDRCGNLKLVVGSGVALGCDGDPIYVPKDQTFTVGDCDVDVVPDTVWVLLCANSKCCAPRTAACGCDDDTPSSTPTRVRDGFEIRVVRNRPKCLCGCEPPKQASDKPPTGDAALESSPFRDPCPCGPTDGCYADHYAGKCACCDDCSDDGSCDCSCVLLAQVTLQKQDDGTDKWIADYSYRRFIRPIFMRDPRCAPPKPVVKEMTVEAMELAELKQMADRELLRQRRPKKARAGV